DIQDVDAGALWRVLHAASVWLDAHVAEVNVLNVFPVPDGDTGTNMSLTMRAALQEARERGYKNVSELARLVSRGALMGARGNSGVILSQVLRGFARALDDLETFDAMVLAQALREGANTAYKGVMKPVEGTMLTVIREAADAAIRAAEQGGGLADVLGAALQEANASLERTPSLLPVLAEAGVVDAGGKGLCLLLEGVWRYIHGQPVAEREVEEVTAAHALAPEGGEYNYDTQFVILGADLDVELIRRDISAMGDSVLVVGDRDAVKVHVHSDFPGRILDYGASHGQITDVVVENMQLQYEAFKAARHAGQPMEQKTATSQPVASSHLSKTSAAARGLSDICVVAVASGEGLQKVFESLGADVIVPGGQTMNPSTQDLLQAVESVCSDKVIILPNNSNIVLAAQQAVALSKRAVAVVPTKTIPQGISALLAFNYQGDMETNIALMTEASQAVQTVEITRAVRSVQVNGLSITEGQIIGLLDGDLATVGTEVDAVALELLARIGMQECEIVTIYFGEDVDEASAQKLAHTIQEAYPGVEVEVVDGGQPHYYYILGVE
ncbi:MAG: DAK2 domain-containing protein, partial [Chloroflexi bacterium]|nr:DAK2 domain-containing protein [Chloroflexota bacterium]